MHVDITIFASQLYYIFTNNIIDDYIQHGVLLDLCKNR